MKHTATVARPPHQAVSRDDDHQYRGVGWGVVIIYCMRQYEVGHNTLQVTGRATKSNKAI